MFPQKKISLYLNYLHFLKHALWLKLNSSHRVPLTLHIGLTAKCPYRCRYCNFKEVARPDRLTVENLGKILEDAYRLGTRRINITGGEPVIHPDFDRIVDLAVGFGFIVTVSTSGYRADHHLPTLRKCDPVMLSLEGSPEVHARLCGELSAREVFKAVDLFFRSGINFWTTTLLTRINLDQIDWVVEHARRYDSLANFSLLEARDEMGPDFHPTSEQAADLFPAAEECRRAITHLIELKKQGAPIGSTLPYLEELLRWPDYSRLWSTESSGRYVCLAGRAACEIANDGTLYACGWEIGRKTPLSVIDLGLAEAFRRLPLPENCKSCASNCWTESNLIFNLNLRAVFNWIRRL